MEEERTSSVSARMSLREAVSLDQEPLMDHSPLPLACPHFSTRAYLCTTSFRTLAICQLVQPHAVMSSRLTEVHGHSLEHFSLSRLHSAQLKLCLPLVPGGAPLFPGSSFLVSLLLSLLARLKGGADDPASKDEGG